MYSELFCERTLFLLRPMTVLRLYMWIPSSFKLRLTDTSGTSESSSAVTGQTPGIKYQLYLA